MRVCIHCEEPIEPGEPTQEYANGPAAHHNCFMRGIIGSVAHVEGRCSCYIPGAQEGDDPKLTRRQAADAAVDAWERMQKVYPLRSEDGMLWRMDGSRPISLLANRVMQDIEVRSQKLGRVDRLLMRWASTKTWYIGMMVFCSCNFIWQCWQAAHATFLIVLLLNAIFGAFMFLIVVLYALLFDSRTEHGSWPKR